MKSLPDTQKKIFDVIVVGAGHAGCEAALAAARMGCSTLLLTISLDTVGWMPCNSSIGGPGRGQLVREIDALGGAMAKIADRNTIHSRRSNTSKGVAVQAPFAIVDKRKYLLSMKNLLENTPNLHLRQALIQDIKPIDGYLILESVFTEEFVGRTVVLAAGTFMHGEIVYGDIMEPAGRYSEVSAPEISEALVRLGFSLGRFKTGTSPRVARKSIDLKAMQAMMPDKSPEPFSFWTEDFNPLSLPCYKTYTTKATEDIILKHLAESPLYNGFACAMGTRYCPSIEDKVIHSQDRERHPVFLQPEGDDQSELYIHGLSTSLPVAVQEKIIRSTPGLEKAEIMRPGYAVMYDFIYPDQLLPSLETKLISGLFTAGQINGTSGYEEAAAQGLIAGINAALKVKGEPPFILDRSQAYIGVLIDDLVTKGVDEPYRMFTSRAEYRLILRSDNADLRLSKFGYKLGLIDEQSYAKVVEKERFIESAVDDNMCEEETFKGEVPGHVIREVTAEKKYKPYIAQEKKKIDEFKQLEDMPIPDDIDYSSIKGLSKEAVQKLSKIRPSTVGQASRIPGLRQSDLQIIRLKALAKPVHY
ncbi:MAG: tRNA uridine-5-carboxymethylaminomethyl(34) synthesis enzyme MnmG [Firmicutes bacterium]|nr:tRNA uridine-5-carboxymethylaminomethyl(34) synthesis enzyme MnmG [Bacillota bacterium]